MRPLASWSLLAALASESALAAPSCSATPFGVTLKDCVAKVDTGGTIFLEDGVHKADNLKITRPMVIKAVTPGRATVVYGGSFLLDILKSIFNLGDTYLLDGASLFVVETSGATVRFEGLAFQPPVSISTADREPWVVGRVITTFGSKVELVHDTLLPADVDGDGLDDAWRVYESTRPAADRVGGILVSAGPSTTLVVDGGFYRATQGSELVGSLIHAAGAGTTVTLTGPVRVEDGVSGEGQVAVVEGARLTVVENAGGAPSFERNQGRTGGALFAGARSTVEVKAGNFLQNVVRRSPLGIPSAGGSVGAAATGAILITGGDFRGGEAAFGGAIGGINATISVSGGTFGENRARIGGHIASIFDSDQAGKASLVVERLRFQDGVAELLPEEIAYNANADGDSYIAMGGAIGVSGGSASIKETEFAAAFAGDAGGAIGSALAELSLAGVAVDGSSAPYGGAVAALGGTLSTTGCTWTGNGADENVAGGAIAVGDADWVDAGSVFSGNRAGLGGGAFCYTGGTCSMSATRFSDNVGTQGGGLWAIAGSVEMDRPIFTANTAREGGGHVTVLSGAYGDGDEVTTTVVLEGGTFTGGRAGVYGGGLAAVGANLTALGSSFVDNRAEVEEGLGGGWYVQDGRATLSDVTFSGNRAVAGGAIYAMNTEIEGAGGRYDDNRAQTGGAIAGVGLVEGAIERGVFCGNESEGLGSAILLAHDGRADTFRLSNNLIDGWGGSGRGLVVVSGRPVFLDHNNLVRAPDTALVLDRAPTEARYNLIAWSGGRFAISWNPSVVLAESNAFWGPERGEEAWVEGQDAPGDAIRGDPRLRGFLTGMPEGCALDDHHPRPTSALLVDGWPTTPRARHVGIFGGEHQFLPPWTIDSDVDQMPAIFDCDDRDDQIAERFVQYQDRDVDGLGGDAYAGDDCLLVSGNVVVPGDCDDGDPLRAVDCGEPVRYFGASCSAVGDLDLRALWPALVLLALRRRRV